MVVLPKQQQQHRREGRPRLLSPRWTVAYPSKSAPLFPRNVSTEAPCVAFLRMKVVRTAFINLEEWRLRRLVRGLAVAGGGTAEVSLDADVEVASCAAAGAGASGIVVAVDTAAADWVLTSPIVFVFASIAIAGRRVVVNGKRGVVSIMDYRTISMDRLETERMLWAARWWRWLILPYWLRGNSYKGEVQVKMAPTSISPAKYLCLPKKIWWYLRRTGTENKVMSVVHPVPRGDSLLPPYFYLLPPNRHVDHAPNICHVDDHCTPASLASIK